MLSGYHQVIQQKRKIPALTAGTFIVKEENLVLSLYRNFIFGSYFGCGLRTA